MKCQWCDKVFPHKRGRFCGSCHPVEKPAHALKRLEEMRYEIIDMLGHHKSISDYLDSAEFYISDAIHVLTIKIKNGKVSK